MSAAENRSRARLEFAAVARCALDVCDELHRRGLEDDDRPRLWLDAAVRWGLGEKDAATLAGRTTALTYWISKTYERIYRGDFASNADVFMAWRLALYCIDDARKDIGSHVTHAPRQITRARERLETVWCDLGDPEPLAAQRVRESYRRHIEALVTDRTAARLQLTRAQAERDREECERCLALPLMGTP